MRNQPTLAAALVVLASTLIVAGSAGAQSAPTTGLEELGLGANDVREEPSHVADANGFPREHPGEYWSPTGDQLILDSVAEQGHVFANEDLDNVVNRALHGDNYDDHERTMYPGPNFFTAWWGWWSDTGGGGDLQGNDATRGAPQVGDPNGAIDDADDCEDHTWDEFTWRGDHPCPEATQHAAYPDDRMFAFVQPGTHRLTVNQISVFGDPVSAVLNDEADHPQQPDFAYANGGQSWPIEGTTPRLTYDASLLISTSVVTAVNPAEAPIGSRTFYQPFTPAGDAGDHAVDVDVYTAVNPAVERAYRTAVWDPATGPNPDRGDNPDVLHEHGPKAWLKDDGAAARRQAERAANDNLSRITDTVEPQVGLVDDLVQDPFFHEPNHPDDDYNGWATHDPTTTYGGLDGTYYEPGDDQAYPGYQSGERFWMDAQVEVNALPWTIPRLSLAFKGAHVTPDAPSTDAPAASLAQEDSTTQAPGFMFFYAWAGTWYDGAGDGVGDQDGWVGDADDDAPYGHGTVDDPNSYQEEESPLIPSGSSAPEWRGTCGVDINATLYPTSDTDGDGINDWGAAGVYVMGDFSDRNPYSNVWMDVVGSAADPVLDPLRENALAGDRASYWFPEDDQRLTRYRTTGPIDVGSWWCFGAAHDVGHHPALYHIVLPTGTLDFTFEMVTNGTLVDDSRQGKHGETQGDDLAGQTITDVDRYGRILPGGS